jgi:microcystin-dependent protein
MTAYVGEIRMFAGNFAPAGWMFCEGQALPISENETLFQLIGTTYGGDGESTFNLPNLASRIPLHMGTGPDGTTYQIGEQAGTEQETLTMYQIPSHMHVQTASTNLSTAAYTSANGVLGAGQKIYTGNGGGAPMAANAVGPTGGNQPHDNMSPYLCINFIISLFGIFPSQA